MTRRTQRTACCKREGLPWSIFTNVSARTDGNRRGLDRTGGWRRKALVETHLLVPSDRHRSLAFAVGMLREIEQKTGRAAQSSQARAGSMGCCAILPQAFSEPHGALPSPARRDRAREVRQWATTSRSSSYIITAYVVMAYAVVADVVVVYVVMAYIIMAYVVVIYVVMAYVILAYIVMAYVGLAYVVMAYVVMTYVSYDLCSYGLCSYDLCSYDLCSYDLCSCGLGSSRATTSRIFS